MDDEIKRKKTGGRKIGSLNKPKPNRDVLKQVLGAYIHDTATGISQFEKDLQCLTPAERLTHVKDFMPYVFPRLQNIQVDATIDADVTIEDKISNLL